MPRGAGSLKVIHCREHHVRVVYTNYCCGRRKMARGLQTDEKGGRIVTMTMCTRGTYLSLANREPVLTHQQPCSKTTVSQSHFHGLGYLLLIVCTCFHDVEFSATTVAACASAVASVLCRAHDLQLIATKTQQPVCCLVVDDGTYAFFHGTRAIADTGKYMHVRLPTCHETLATVFTTTTKLSFSEKRQQASSSTAGK